MLHRRVMILSFLVLSYVYPGLVFAQSSSQWGVCEFATLTQMNAFTPNTDDWTCKFVYVKASHEHYEWSGSAWTRISTTDSQTLSLSGNSLSIQNGNTVDLSGLTGLGDNLGSHTATENLQLGTFWLSNDGGDEGIAIQADGDVGIGTNSPDARLDVEGGSVRFSDYGVGNKSGTEAYQIAVDADGDLIEQNTAKSAGIFYPPAIALDASSTGTGRTLDLHQEYEDRFGSPSVASSGAPSAIPAYTESELYYYVTDYDAAVMDNVSISSAGVMTYDIIATPSSGCTILNIVFVVK